MSPDESIRSTLPNSRFARRAALFGAVKWTRSPSEKLRSALLVNGDASEPTRIVLPRRFVRPFHLQRVLPLVDLANRRVCTRLEAKLLTTFRVADPVPFSILRRPRPIGPAHILATHQHGGLMVFAADDPALLQLVPDVVI